MSNSARIESPEILKEFRNHLVKFEGRCRQAAYEAKADTQQVLHWIQHDQHQHWKHEFRKREELLLRARSAYLLARHGATHLRKPSWIEEERAMKRAEARKIEAEQKLETVKRWAGMLEQRTEKLMGPISNLSVTLDTTVPLALSRLDSMIQNLEEYMRSFPATGGGPTGLGGTKDGGPAQ